MHLDTVFTQVDRDKFSVHPGILEMLSIYELTGRGTGRITTRALRMPLEDVLKEYLHLDHVQLIRCGGGCEIAACLFIKIEYLEFKNSSRYSYA